MATYTCLSFFCWCMCLLAIGLRIWLSGAVWTKVLNRIFESKGLRVPVITSVNSSHLIFTDTLEVATIIPLFSFFKHHSIVLTANCCIKEYLMCKCWNKKVSRTRIYVCMAKCIKKKLQDVWDWTNWVKQIFSYLTNGSMLWFKDKFQIFLLSTKLLYVFAYHY